MRHSFSLKKESSLTHIQPQPLVLHPIEMFSSRSRRKSMSDTSASTVSTVGKKRRASNGFNTETMESVNGALGSGGGGGMREDRGMLADLRHPGLNAIRFASYRTAAKLRYVQKKTNMHLVDIWNIIEAFRENGLNTLDANNGVKVSRLETLISTLYHSLNKRLPSDKQINIQTSTSVLLNWLLAAYDRDSSGRLQVFSVKVGLATLCNSKPLDKLRYIFSQISDSNGHLALTRFSEYLKEVLALPAAVFESPSFPFAESLVSRIFEGHVTKINVNDFMDVMLGEPGPECLTWLPLLHRLAASESDELWATDLIDDDFLSEFVHQTGCDGCRRESFSGLRYKCDRCYNYNLCQDCFWVGRVSPPHSLDHQVKEYMTSSPTRAIGASVRRSLRCVPDRLPSDRPRYPETPERTLDLAHIVPPSPNIGHNSIEDNLSGPPGSSADTWSSGRRQRRRSADSWQNFSRYNEQKGRKYSQPSVDDVIPDGAQVDIDYRGERRISQQIKIQHSLNKDLSKALYEQEYKEEIQTRQYNIDQTNERLVSMYMEDCKRKNRRSIDSDYSTSDDGLQVDNYYNVRKFSEPISSQDQISSQSKLKFHRKYSAGNHDQLNNRKLDSVDLNRRKSCQTFKMNDNSRKEELNDIFNRFNQRKFANKFGSKLFKFSRSQESSPDIIRTLPQIPILSKIVNDKTYKKQSISFEDFYCGSKEEKLNSRGSRSDIEQKRKESLELEEQFRKELRISIQYPGSQNIKTKSWKK